MIKQHEFLWGQNVSICSELAATKNDYTNVFVVSALALMITVSRTKLLTTKVYFFSLVS